MKLPACLIIQLCALTGFAFGQEAFSPPERFPIDRYAKILNKSPFAQATLLQETKPQENFAKDLVLISHYRFGGILVVNLQNSKNQQRLVATSDADSTKSMKAVSVSPNNNPWEATVVIEYLGEKGTVAYAPPNFPKPPNAPALAASQPNKASTEPLHRTRVRSAQDD